MLTLRPTGLLPLVTDNLPMRLLADQLLDGSASRTRDFRPGEGGVGINGAIWDMNRIDVQAQQGTGNAGTFMRIRRSRSIFRACSS